MGMNDIRFYFFVFARRLPQILAIAATIAALGIVVICLLPSKYRASAEILVEAPQISATLAPSTVPNNAVEQLGIYQQEITTREHLLELASRFHVFGSKRAEMSEYQIVRTMRDRTTFDLVSNASNGSGATVFSVSFEDPDPKIAAAIVNEFVSLILQKNRRVRNGRAEETLAFFSSEVSRLNDELKKQDAEILKFENENRDALPDSLDSRRVQQSTAQQRLQMLEWEEAGLRNRRNSLIEMYQSTGDTGPAAVLTPEQQTLQDLKRTLADQLVVFSETSPNIVALKARIADMQKSIRQGVTTESRTTETMKTKAAPSQLDLQLSDIDERLEFIGKERVSINQALASLARTIAATPTNETALNAMERTRQNTQSQYAAAVERYAAASTGKEIEADAKGERFSVVEPAIAPDRPTSPKRLRLAALAVFAGLAVGAGFAVLMEMINQTVRRPAEIAKALQIRPIATIPSIGDRSPRRFWRPAAMLWLLAITGLGQILWIRSAGNP